MIYHLAKFLSRLTPTYWIYAAYRRCRRLDSYTASRGIDNAFLIIALGALLLRFGFEKIVGVPPDWLLFLAILQISRAIEIPLAFLTDSIDTLRGKPTRSSDIPRQRRIELLISVYFELMLNYASLYACLGGNNWSVWDANPSRLAELVKSGVITPAGTLTSVSSFYYSVVTMTTVGFGDIAAIRQLPRVMTVAQILSSLILAVLSIAMYALDPSKGVSVNNSQRSTTDGDTKP